MKAKLLGLFLISLLGFSLAAQEISDDPARPVLTGIGKIFVVRLTPGSGRVQVGLLSDMNNEIETGRLKVSAKQISNQGQSEPLPLELHEGHFKVNKKISTENVQYEFHVLDTKTKKSETVKVKERP